MRFNTDTRPSVCESHEGYWNCVLLFLKIMVTARILFSVRYFGIKMRVVAPLCYVWGRVRIWEESRVDSWILS